MKTVDLAAQTSYLRPDECGGGLETFLDIFVVLKAVTITYFSAQGIIVFSKAKKFNSLAVQFTLIVSIALVSQANPTHSPFFCCPITLFVEFGCR